MNNTSTKDKKKCELYNSKNVVIIERQETNVADVDENKREKTYTSDLILYTAHRDGNFSSTTEERLQGSEHSISTDPHSQANVMPGQR